MSSKEKEMSKVKDVITRAKDEVEMRLNNTEWNSGQVFGDVAQVIPGFLVGREAVGNPLSSKEIVELVNGFIEIAELPELEGGIQTYYDDFLSKKVNYNSIYDFIFEAAAEKNLVKFRSE